MLSPSKSLDRGINDLAPNSRTPKKGSGGGQTDYFATPNRCKLASRHHSFIPVYQAWGAFDPLQEQQWSVWQPGEGAWQDEEHAHTQVYHNFQYLYYLRHLGF